MANRGYRIGFWGVAMLVALRVLIGWHFFTAGIEKLDPSFSAADNLRSANGPLADFYKSFAPLPHEWDRLAAQPMPPVSEYESEQDANGLVPYPTEAYGPWAARIADDWHDTMQRFTRLPDLTEAQTAAAQAVFDEHYIRLARYFEGIRPDLANFHHEVEDRLQPMLESEAAGTLPYMEGRILKKKAEVQAAPRKWVADIEAEEEMYLQHLADLRTDEQRESAAHDAQVTAVFSPPGTIAMVDTAVTWLTLGVGICLIFGLFTRVAAVVGALFLLSVMSMQPPWAEGVLNIVKLLFAYQGIELLGLLLLAAAGAGAWAGLDAVLFGRKVDE